MMSDTMPLPVTVRDGLGNGNVFMSLPTSLIHCILSDWVEVVSLIRLDIAFCGDAEFHLQLLDILKSDLFYVKRFDRPKNLPLEGIPPLEHPYTHMLDWIVRLHVKVVHIEPHKLCSHVVLDTFLRQYGEHVRHICPCEDYDRMDKYHHIPTQSALIEKYCRNLTAYAVYSWKRQSRCIWGVLNNNPRLEKLYINGSLDGGNDPINNPIATLHHLQQLQWADNYGFSHSLVTLVRAAPNLQKLSICCNAFLSTSGSIVEVARACPNLRTLSCNELHFGPKDRSLQPFFAACSGIVNLDLSMHYELTDTVLIEALGELHSLHCLHLRGCSRLTDRTLQFLAQRFQNTLQVLYLEYSVMRPRYYGEAAEQGGYTTAGIASLRAQCTHLHTFHYSVQVHVRVPAPPLYAYQNATIVHMCSGYATFLPMILEHCQQMQILTMTSAHYGSSKVWLTVDQLMAIATRCPQLQTIIIGKKYAHRNDDKEVDYSAVKEAFSKLRFTQDETAADFDILEVPV